MAERNILDLGCGSAKASGAIGVDISPESDADVLADLDAGNLPFAAEVFDEVRMIDSLEHVKDVRATLKEAARVLKPGGAVFVNAPHFSSLHAYSDFTHRHFFSAEGVRMLFGEEEGYGGYAIGGLELTYMKINMWKAWRITGVQWFANRFTGYYEKLFAFRFPAMSLEFRLTKPAKSGTNNNGSQT